MSLFTYSEPAQVGLRTAFSLLVTTNLVGNALVCLVVLRNKTMRNPMNYLLVNLACADMIVAIFITPQYIFLHTYDLSPGRAADYLCKIITGGNLVWTGGVVSVMSLVVIAFERYYAVLFPHDDKRRISNRKLKFIIPALWLFSFLWNLPLFKLVLYSEETKFCYEAWSDGWYLNAYSLGWLVAIGILPLSVMIALYSRVIFNLWIRASDRLDRDPIRRTAEMTCKRVIKMVLTVTVFCAVCWLPNLIVYVLDFYGLITHGDIAHTTTVVLVTLNSSINPVIYCFQSKRFRTCVKVLLFSPCSMRRIAEVAPRSIANLPESNDCRNIPTK